MGCRGGAAFAHLRKVCGTTFGRCAENAENCSPSEGGIGTMYRQTGLQYALGAVAFLSTFGRCAENTGNCSPSEGGTEVK